MCVCGGGGVYTFAISALKVLCMYSLYVLVFMHVFCFISYCIFIIHL